jgi:hypothetical protein
MALGITKTRPLGGGRVRGASGTATSRSGDLPVRTSGDGPALAVRGKTGRAPASTSRLSAQPEQRCEPPYGVAQPHDSRLAIVGWLRPCFPGSPHTIWRLRPPSKCGTPRRWSCATSCCGSRDMSCNQVALPGRRSDASRSPIMVSSRRRLNSAYTLSCRFLSLGVGHGPGRLIAAGSNLLETQSTFPASPTSSRRTQWL